jgi:hypothetical protein
MRVHLRVYTYMDLYEYPRTFESVKQVRVRFWTRRQEVQLIRGSEWQIGARLRARAERNPRGFLAKHYAHTCAPN